MAAFPALEVFLSRRNVEYLASLRQTLGGPSRQTGDLSRQTGDLSRQTGDLSRAYRDAKEYARSHRSLAYRALPLWAAVRAMNADLYGAWAAEAKAAEVKAAEVKAAEVKAAEVKAAALSRSSGGALAIGLHAPSTLAALRADDDDSPGREGCATRSADKEYWGASMCELHDGPAVPEGEQTYDGVAYGGEVPYTTERAKGRLARAPKKTHMPEAPGMSFEREAPVRRWLTE